MIDSFLQFLIFLGIVAAFLQDDYIFTILYFFTGVYLIGRLWSSRSLNKVRYCRTFMPRAFLGENITIDVDVNNESFLPVIWLKIQESIPTELMTKSLLRQVISLGPKSNQRFEYTLHARRRGYYPIGPVFLSTGDLFGISGIQRKTSGVDHIIIYPKIIYLTKLSLPSFSPPGSLAHQQPIFEDPVRIFGKREYVRGDTMRKIDWKATAAKGDLLVKIFEPSVALETMIYLNLNREDYDYKRRWDLIELAIIVAASISYWVTSKKESVGLVTNGTDPISGSTSPKPLLPKQGRAHLTQILDVLARVESSVTGSLPSLLQHEHVHLPWGSTVILITGKPGDSFFNELFRIHRLGLNIVILIIGDIVNWSETKSHAEYFGFQIYHIRNEFDLDMWRK